MFSEEFPDEIDDGDFPVKKVEPTACLKLLLPQLAPERAASHATTVAAAIIPVLAERKVTGEPFITSRTAAVPEEFLVKDKAFPYLQAVRVVADFLPAEEAQKLFAKTNRPGGTGSKKGVGKDGPTFTYALKQACPASADGFPFEGLPYPSCDAAGPDWQGRNAPA